MKKIINLIPIVIIIFFNSCDSKKKENNIKNHDLKLLEKQIKAGYAAEKNETDYPNYNFSKSDLNSSNQILKDYLIKNGYKIPDNKKFNDLVNKTFQRSLDYNSAKKNVYLDFTNPCDREIKFLKNSSKEQQDVSFYISKEGNFITELFSIPEILDYEKVYPEMKILEEKLPLINNNIKIYKWSSLENLSRIREQNLKTLLSRNKFLFNDSKIDLVWLLANDKKFLIDLVVKFGFDKEKQINQIALEELYAKYKNENPIQVEKIGDLFFSKNCDNSLSIRYGLLEYLKEITTEKDNRFIYALSDYASILYDGDLNNVFEKDPSKRFNDVQKANIIALIASIENQAKNKFKYKNAVLWNNESTAIEDLSVSHPEVVDIIVKNKYFGIENLKEIIDNLGSDE
jgi:hypothetical protein